VSRIFFDDIDREKVVTSAGLTVTDAHIVMFAGVSGDFNPLHMDARFAATTGIGRVIAHGMLGHALSTGLRSEIDDWAISAFMETGRKFVQPIFAGDTVYYTAQVEEMRESRSRPEIGIVRVAIRLLNQDDVVVQQGTDVFAVTRKGHGS